MNAVFKDPSRRVYECALDDLSDMRDNGGILIASHKNVDADPTVPFAVLVEGVTLDEVEATCPGVFVRVHNRNYDTGELYPQLINKACVDFSRVSDNKAGSVRGLRTVWLQTVQQTGVFAVESVADIEQKLGQKFASVELVR